MKKLFISILIIIVILIIIGIYLDNLDNKKVKILESDKVFNKNENILNKNNLISIYPEKIYSGDPIIVEIKSSSTPIKFTYDNKEIPIIKFNNKDLVFIGTELRETKADHNIKIAFKNGIIEKQIIKLNIKKLDEKPLDIPDKLGGNTPEAGKSLLDNIAKENLRINSIKSTTTKLWSKSFSAPLKSLYITDTYGYSRNTVGYSIAHKGTDFRASVGTEVMAINDGYIRLIDDFTLSGKTILIDHGSGITSIYMHLSKINVTENEFVKAGQVIGLSGDTGYVNGAHLHLSIKINGISIDPAKFLKYFNVL